MGITNRYSSAPVDTLTGTSWHPWRGIRIVHRRSWTLLIRRFCRLGVQAACLKKPQCFMALEGGASWRSGLFLLKSFLNASSLSHFNTSGLQLTNMRAIRCRANQRAIWCPVISNTYCKLSENQTSWAYNLLSKSCSNTRLMFGYILPFIFHYL